MAKRFFYMLAVAFILQLSWGVASAYCLHESGPASEHFGHHQHQHQDADEDNSPSPKKAAFHPDCATCSHHLCAVFAWSSMSALSMLPDHQFVASFDEHPAPISSCRNALNGQSPPSSVTARYP
jgi:hypothetical protein